MIIDYWKNQFNIPTFIFDLNIFFWLFCVFSWLWARIFIFTCMYYWFFTFCTTTFHIAHNSVACIRLLCVLINTLLDTQCWLLWQAMMTTLDPKRCESCYGAESANLRLVICFHIRVILMFESQILYFNELIIVTLNKILAQFSCFIWIWVYLLQC